MCSDSTILTINYLIILGKWFLNNKKTLNKEITFFEFLQYLKDKLETLKVVYRLNNKEKQFDESYGRLLNEL